MTLAEVMAELDRLRSVDTSDFTAAQHLAHTQQLVHLGSLYSALSYMAKSRERTEKPIRDMLARQQQTRQQQDGIPPAFREAFA